jgi:hypothetical protein
MIQTDHNDKVNELLERFLNISKSLALKYCETTKKSEKDTIELKIQNLIFTYLYTGCTSLNIDPYIFVEAAITNIVNLNIFGIPLNECSKKVKMIIVNQLHIILNGNNDHTFTPINY